ncbi:flp pilus assembly protein TadB [Acetobacter aceti NRIC 0242]|uniref:Uncharacterized protein n=1 Tax=Acetobacter aceti NBRC 14818 TaxID=887700 RepID=A0AB33IAZ2_ACEAC|nr:hypothetical protein [Acetobacter aceti]TCS35336.1 hypothetical protein EDC15_101133 [Acetobacter aceti NBRC 14818]BCK75276.1 hypothetical protein EMQ_0882 [Acetobacter aceti NBRC 14818]GAN57434.1 hypothetical protein Abac_017_135 [Acetobacter aceti NBRC 14818]GBO79426.1 flp pilus assembly protein TadB [Acetobacter aceti NRIC 0242]
MNDTMKQEKRDVSVSPLSGIVRLRRKTARFCATCAMGAWVVLGAVPFLIMLIELI